MTLLIWEYGGALPPPEKRIYDISSGIVCESDNYLSNIHNPGQTSRKLCSGSTLLDRVSLGVAGLMYEMPSKFKVGVIHELPLP
jgi:hypothetical protein